MSRASVDRGQVIVDLDATERRLLGTVVEDTVLALVDPTDPARARLLPDGYRDDPDAAAEFARYTRDDLRRGKIDAAREVVATLARAERSRILLGRDDADRWTRVLTDARLLLAERAGIRADGEEPEDEPTAIVYAWLGELQWSLVDALDRLERKGRRDRRL